MEQGNCREVQKVTGLEIETDDAVYEIEFGQVQIEITGRCNMRCQHCRATLQPKQDMPSEQILKIMGFARRYSQNYKEVIVSGGEPLLHSDFSRALKHIRENGGESVTLTTNGSLLTKDHMSLIKDLSFKRFILSVSLDNLDPKIHDDFRGYKNAFPKAVQAMRLASENSSPEITNSMRSTIQPSQILEMERMVTFAQSLGCRRISFSAVHPSGSAIHRKDLWMTREDKKRFIEEVYRLKQVFSDIEVSTNDPLKCLLRRENDIGTDDELVFDGCGAAVITFNVNSDGTMTPCALLNIPMMNIFPLSIEEIAEHYQRNSIVRNMLAMNLTGKCGTCNKKYQCGGCRARALIQNGDFLAEDPHCWI